MLVIMLDESKARAGNANEDAKTRDAASVRHSCTPLAVATAVRLEEPPLPTEAAGTGAGKVLCGTLGWSRIPFELITKEAGFRTASASHCVISIAKDQSATTSAAGSSREVVRNTGVHIMVEDGIMRKFVRHAESSFGHCPITSFILQMVCLNHHHQYGTGTNTQESGHSNKQAVYMRTGSVTGGLFRIMASFVYIQVQ